MMKYIFFILFTAICSGCVHRYEGKSELDDIAGDILKQKEGHEKGIDIEIKPIIMKKVERKK